MALLVADILTAANSRTGRAESNINTFMRGVLHELSNRGLALSTEEAFTLTDEDYDIAFTEFTAKFNKIKVITITDSNDLPSDPLRKINWKQFKERLSQNLAAGEPVEYCIYPEFGAKTLYLSPKPDADNYPTANISGTLRHDDTTTISYPEEYRELLISGVCWMIERKYKVDGPKAAARAGEFKAEILKMFSNVPTIGLSEYSDI